jgi:hypothetical protein
VAWNTYRSHNAEHGSHFFVADYGIKVENAPNTASPVGSRERGARLKVVNLFKDERLTGAVLDFLKDTDIGKRYE